MAVADWTTRSHATGVPMRVVRVMAPHVMRLDDAAMPVPQPGEALVRITAVGICGSDLQYYTQGRIGELAFGAGHILGHEVAGVVEALGPDTEGPLPGTPVAVDPAIPCGGCRFCAAGDPNFCERLQFFGSPPRPGALQQYLAHPSRLLLPVPAAWSPPATTVLEPLGVAIHAVDLGHLAVGDAVAVFGCGPIGLMIARVAHLAGARLVCATEPLPHRRAAAARFGATVALDPAADEVVREMKRQTGGYGVDVAFEAAGSESATVQAIQALRPGGTLVLLGYWKRGQVTLPGITAMRKGLTVRFVRRMKNTFERAIALVRDGLVDVQGLVTHEFPLAQAAEAFARAEQRTPDVVKTVIRL
jgi:L-iditol 2-dehydrogenase